MGWSVGDLGSLLVTVLEVQGGSESASVYSVWGLCSFPLQCFCLGFLTSENGSMRAPQASSCSLEPLFQRILAKASYRLKSQLLERVHKQSSSRGHAVQAKSQPSHFRSGLGDSQQSRMCWYCHVSRATLKEMFFTYLFGCTGSSLRHAECFFFFSCGMWDLVS